MISPFTFANGQREDPEFSLQDVEYLDVDASFLNVHIQGGGEEGPLRMKSSLPQGRKFEVQVKRMGNRVNVSLKRTGIFSFFLFGETQGDLYFLLPSGTKTSLVTASGDIAIEEVSQGQLKIKSTSGNISIQDSWGNMTIKTVSGDMNLDQIQGNLDLETTSGSIACSQSEGTFLCNTVSGDQRFDTHQGRLQSHSVSGDLKLENITGTIDSRTVSGDLSSQNLVLKDNAQFHSTSGNIKLELDGPWEKYRFDLKSTSGNLEIRDRKAEKNLSFGSGPVTILGRTVSGNIRIE